MNNNNNWKQREPKLPISPFDDLLDTLGKINGIENVEEFLNPTEEHLHDPYFLKNVEEASNAILRAVAQDKKIAVSFDVDADGITSGSIAIRYLRQVMRPSNLYHIYAERSDGHGIENQLSSIEPGTDLLIVVDSSSNSVEACKTLHEAGVQVVILDHHPVEVENPYAIVVNPQNPGDEYPNKELSGAGVVYKTLQVVDDSLCTDRGVEPFLDLVAVGLGADVMSVAVMENRYLISQGLRNICNPGLLAILKVAKVYVGNVNSQTIGFTFGPFLNGAARMGNLGLAIDLLLEDDPKRCGALAKQVRDLNDERKRIEAEVYERLRPMVNENDKITMVWDTDIDKSFNGLVATKFTSKLKRPAIVLQDTGKYLSGSYRAPGDFDMKAFLRGFKAHMEADLMLPAGENYGFVEGHPQAGGFGIHKVDLNLLRKYANEHLADVAFENAVEFDMELPVDEIDTDLMKEVEQFNWISGKGVPMPKFLIRGLKVVKVEVIGKNTDTVKITCGNGLVLMKFRTDPSFAWPFEPVGTLDPFTEKQTFTPTVVDVVGTLNINSFYHGGLKAMVYTNQVFLEEIIKTG